MKYLKVKREKSTSEVRHYVRNADLIPAIIEAKQLGHVTARLSDLFWKIAENYSRKHNFVKYSFRTDMVASAAANLCQNALKFNHEKYDNPFSYYTTAIHNSFLQFIADEKKHAKLRDELIIQAGANPSFGYNDTSNVDSDNRTYVAEPDFNERDLDLSAGEDSLTDFENVKIQHRAKIPGPVLKYGPGDYEICPVTGNFILKKKEELVVTEKKARKPSAKKEEVTGAPVKKEPTKPVRAKKAAPVEVVEKKPAKKATAIKPKPTKEAASEKKVVKPTAKKVAAKKVAAKKATKKGA